MAYLMIGDDPMQFRFDTPSGFPYLIRRIPGQGLVNGTSDMLEVLSTGGGTPDWSSPYPDTAGPGDYYQLGSDITINFCLISQAEVSFEVAYGYRGALSVTGIRISTTASYVSLDLSWQENLEEAQQELKIDLSNILAEEQIEDYGYRFFLKAQPDGTPVINEFTSMMSANERSEMAGYQAPVAPYEPAPEENLVAVVRTIIKDGKAQVTTEQIRTSQDIVVDCHAIKIINCRRNNCQLDNLPLDSNDPFELPLLPGGIAYDTRLRLTFNDGQTGLQVPRKYGTTRNLIDSINQV
jgi:hypothetical protein